MTRCLCCLAVVAAVLGPAAVVSAQSAEAPGAPIENILEATAPEETPAAASPEAPAEVAPTAAAASSVPVAATSKPSAGAQHGILDSLIARHAAVYNVPEVLIRRVIKRESGGNPKVISKGNYGLMQIRLGTARALGYQGGAAGLLDAETNMTYAVKYLAGALQAAGGNHDRAVHYYAAGYYYAAKRMGLSMPGSHRPLNIIAINTAGANDATATSGTSKSPGRQQ